MQANSPDNGIHVPSIRRWSQTRFPIRLRGGITLESA